MFMTKPRALPGPKDGTKTIRKQLQPSVKHQPIRKKLFTKITARKIQRFRRDHVYPYDISASFS